MKQTEETVREALRSVYDPEISINVQDLGLIYEVSVTDDHVFVKHSLTSFMCPFADEICANIKKAILELPGVNSVHAELTFDPPFTINMVPEETRMFLGL